jgi:hypothetical protein
VARFKSIQKLIQQTVPTICAHDFHDEAIEALHREGTALPETGKTRRPARGVRTAKTRAVKREKEKPKGVSGAKAAKEKRSGRPFRGFGRGRP